MTGASLEVSQGPLRSDKYQTRQDRGTDGGVGAQGRGRNVWGSASWSVACWARPLSMAPAHLVAAQGVQVVDLDGPLLSG